jgi:DNA-binding Xre family transcriptional regulator
MNLIRIKSLAEKKNVSIRNLSQQIKMSEQNLHKCIRDNRMEAGELEKIAAYLNVPINYFFIADLDKLGDEPKINIKQEHNGNGHNIAAQDAKLSECTKEIEHLREIIKLKDEIISVMKGK